MTPESNQRFVYENAMLSVSKLILQSTRKRASYILLFESDAPRPPFLLYEDPTPPQKKTNKPIF